MTRDELILQIVEGLDKKLDHLNMKMDDRFANLKCNEQNLRITRIEDKLQDQRDHRKTLFAIGVAALGAFGLSLWQWIRGA
jgi:hypothetical protein